MEDSKKTAYDRLIEQEINAWSKAAARTLTYSEYESMVLDFYDVLDALRNVHEDFPDLRLGQILENARGQNSLFYMSNRELRTAVRDSHRSMLDRQDE